MNEKQVLISENTLLFLLDKVEECYKPECAKIVKKFLSGSLNLEKIIGLSGTIDKTVDDYFKKQKTEKVNYSLKDLEQIINKLLIERIEAIKEKRLPSSTIVIQFLNEIYLLLKIKKELN